MIPPFFPCLALGSSVFFLDRFTHAFTLASCSITDVSAMLFIQFVRLCFMYPYSLSVSTTHILVQSCHTSLPFHLPPIALVTSRMVMDEITSQVA